MAKKTRAQRKAANIRAETQRRIDAGDRSSYVQKSGKQHGLNVPTRTPYNPNKVSHVIKETTGLSGRDAYLANQAFRAQTANNQRITAQHAKRRAVEEAFARNGSVSRGDFTGNMGDGIFGLNTGRATPTGKPKLREGLTSAEYHDWMRKLNKLNRPMMEQIFPWGSGKTARGLVTLATPLKYLEQMPSLFGNQLSNVKEGLTKGLQNIFPGAMEDLGFEKNKLMQNFEGIGGRFQNDLQALLSGKNQNLADIKSTDTQEDIISPATLSGTDTAPMDSVFDVGEYSPFYDEHLSATGKPINFGMIDELSDRELYEMRSKLQGRGGYDQMAEADVALQHNINPEWAQKYNFGIIPPTSPGLSQFSELPPGAQQNIRNNLDDVGWFDRSNRYPQYFEGMAHGGDVQSDAYARLKAINDSMHEM